MESASRSLCVRLGCLVGDEGGHALLLRYVLGAELKGCGEGEDS